MMNPKQRIQMAVGHVEPDKVPAHINATRWVVAKLKSALNVYTDRQLLEALHIDVYDMRALICTPAWRQNTLAHRANSSRPVGQELSTAFGASGNLKIRRLPDGTTRWSLHPYPEHFQLRIWMPIHGPTLRILIIPIFAKIWTNGRTFPLWQLVALFFSTLHTFGDGHPDDGYDGRS